MREANVVWRGAVRAIIALWVALALACGGGAMAEGPDHLYRAAHAQNGNVPADVELRGAALLALSR
jgi:hypothetical protein